MEVGPFRYFARWSERRRARPRLDVRLEGLEARSPPRWVLTNGAAPEGWHALASPADISAMADKAESVLDRPADFRPLSDAGVRLVRERYSSDVCFPQIRDLYEEVANSGVQGAPAR